MNYQSVIAGNQPNSSVGIQEHFDAAKAREGNVQQYVLFPLWSFGSKDPQNTNSNATFEVKEPESKVYVSPSCSAKTKTHDDKTKREAKGKSPVDSNFELGGKSSYVDPSQYPDDPDMLALEDITYSDDEEDVDVEADFSNLETNITILVGLKLCSRSFFNSICKRFRYLWICQRGHTQEEGIDYEEVFAPVVRIEAIRTIEEEVYVCHPLGFEDTDYPNKVYKVVKALYGLHQAPRPWYETLANYLLRNGFQRGRLIRPCSSRSKKEIF
nr:hypothetical protein [Tanacetum cinerariifolium]